jgi:tetratricopeptide (TPR) repeat protein
MSIRRLALLPVLYCCAAAQNPPQPSAAGRELEEFLFKSQQAAAVGDHTTAINLMESALQKVQKDPALKDRESDVLGRLGKAYMDGGRPAEAVRTYQVLFTALGDDCRPGSPGLDRCAEPQYWMGTAQMQKGDFAAAVITLHQATASFAGLVKGASTDLYRMGKLKSQADAQSLLAAALFRTGKKADAIATFERAIEQFSIVEKNPATPETIRASAQVSRKDAQASLDLLKKN